jgi:DNA polymerase elongation subunit (family B)
MAVVCNVPMITLFTKGQQIKVYSNLFKYCLEHKIVPEKDGYNVGENERYVGAYVFPPVPGLYENVVPVDFCSLYPSLIISYNIDFTTCAFDPTIPDELCHVMEWEDHISCKHDAKIIEKTKLTNTIEELTSKKKYNKTLVSQLRKKRSDITKSLNKNVMCEKRKYRFLKVTNDNPEFKGVLPTIVQSLLDSRKETRKEMSMLKEKLKTLIDEQERKEVETTISILNQRQLAYKVSANSMYGITGVKAGMLPFMPVAMSITYMGRKNILKVAEIIQTKYNGLIVAGDTDSNYISFPTIKNIPDLWDHAIKVAEEISALFPPPIKLEFEEAIYTKFLILTKKRYMYKTALRDGTIKDDIGKRGVLLNRRDNSAFIRNTYENMVKIIFENSNSLKELQDKVLNSFIDDVNDMFNHRLPTEDFVITKSTGDYGNLQPQYFLNEKGLHRAMLGQYNVPFLTEQIRETEGVNTPVEEENWYLDKLPAHIQLLEKIRKRGQMRNEGSRLEFVILDTEDLKDKQSAKIETLNYYKKNKDVLNLDYLYYLQRLINPVDQILEVVFGLKDFTKIHYNTRVLKRKLTKKIDDIFSPKFDIEMDKLYLLEENSKYRVIYGSIDHCKKEKKSDERVVFETNYIPTKNDVYSFLKFKYGSKTTLKTQFIFKENYILLGDMSETRLVSTLKKEFK